MEPAIIRKLDEDVVNRIVAGQILQSPVNALKELLENSLDAKSTLIKVSVKSGGLKLLQVHDNGTGIRKEDLTIVCEQFTTSKITKFEDLTNIATFGFRGLALSSISHVAHLTIQTKTAQEKCGYKASYEDGKLTAPPKHCAVNQGTIVTIEDLFYNMPQRKQALQLPNEEFQKIYDVLGKYAVHNPKVGFMLKRYGEKPSLNTSPSNTQELNIQIIYGDEIAKALMAVSMTDDMYKLNMKGLITNVNYNAKKGIMLLFINHRLVESAALKTAIDAVYSTYLPKGMHAFIYLSLELEPSTVDVNVHPTKHEVRFLYEVEIIEKIKAHIESQLLGSNATRNFYKQLKLSGVTETNNAEKSFKNVLGEKVNAKNVIRTDNKEQKLDKFFHAGVKKNDPTGSLNGLSGTSISNSLPEERFRKIPARKLKEVRLPSVLQMQNNIKNSCSENLKKIVKEMVFVGVVDKCFALFQHETKLYMGNTLKLSEELFYQRLVYGFQNLPLIQIKPEKLPIKHLIRLALDSSESGWTKEDGDKEEIAKRATDVLVEKSNIIREYFSLHISPEGDLETLPSLLPNHCPSKTFLPLYMLRLATKVIWDTDEEYFETFCRETAHYYSLVSLVELEMDSKHYKWTVEHVLYPAFKKYLLPSNRLKKQFYELTNMSTLYKVFERC